MSTTEITRLKVASRSSQIVVHGGVVYLAGQVANDTSADVVGQTRQVLESIELLLAEAGSDKKKILIANIYLANIADVAAMNRIWDVWVPAGHAPARATVQAAMVSPEYLVEIVVIAATGAA